MTEQAFRLAPQEYDGAIPVADIREHPENYNQGDVGAISESMDAHGFYGAIGVQRSTGYILWGNHRYRTAKIMGAASLPGFWLEVDEDEAERILAVDNGTAALAAPDEQKLVDLLTRRAATARGLAGTSYDGDRLDEMIAMLGGGPVLTGQPTDAHHNETEDEARDRAELNDSYRDRKQGGALTELILVFTVEEHTEATGLLGAIRDRDGDATAGAITLAALRAYAP